MVNVFHKHFSFNRLEIQTHLVGREGGQEVYIESRGEKGEREGGKAGGREGVRESRREGVRE